MKHYSINSNNIPQDANLSVKLIEFTSDEAEHTHEGFEVVYVFGGHGEHIVDNKRIKVKRGSLIIMNNSCKHGFRNVEPMQYYNLLFTPDMLSFELNKNADLKTFFDFQGFEINESFIHIELDVEDEMKRIEKLLFDILNEGIKKETGYANIIKIRMAELITVIARKYLKNGSSNDMIDDIFYKIIDYIDENCSENLELEKVAKLFGYDGMSFSLMIKEYFGFGFKKLVTKRKLSRVLSYLWNSDSSIEEIIEECGFTNKSYFYKSFEKQFGVKPKLAREYWENFHTAVKLKI